MSDVRAVTADPATSNDDASTVHYVCCQEWTEGGPTQCGTPIDDFDPPVDGVDQDCVVCVDLYATDPMRCPRFGRCDMECFS